MSKVYMAPDLACVYRWNKESKCLELCELNNDGTFNDEEWGLVEEYAVGDEVVMFHGRDRTLSRVYRIVEKMLKKRG